ncbi:32690_t:CDS:2, partial [Racocetra persica]
DVLNYDFITADNKQDKEKAKKLIDCLNLNFQDYVTISDIQFSLDATISAITIQFIEYNNTSPTYRIHLLIYMTENFIILEQLPSSMFEFALALIQSLKSHFSDTNLYNAMKIFEPRLLPYKECDLSNYGNTEIEILAEFYGNNKKTNDRKIILAVIDKQELKQK